MASYFDEHACEPHEWEGTSEPAANLMDLLRHYLQQDSEDWMTLLPQGERLAPPASKKAVADLPRKQITPSELKDRPKCPVCLVPFDAEEEVILMPCEHCFHKDCLLPWLQKTNSCPLCRHELLTDSPEYEEYKKEKGREKERESRVEQLHNSMFG